VGNVENVRRAAISLAVLSCGVLPPVATFGGQGQAALQRAAALVQEGRLQDADQQARLALSDPETRAAACSVLGTIRLQQDRLREGAELLQEAIRLDPRLLGARLNLAQLYTLQGNYERSLELAKPALAAFKQSPDGVLILATDFLKTGDRSAAAALVEDSRRLGALPLVWSVSFAELLVEGGLVAEGIDVLERARKADPSSYELTFALGSAYLVKGEPARALEAYDLALGRRPDSVTALRQAAVVAEKQGEMERSLSYWMRAKKLAADDPQILLGFGRVCLKMDLLDDAQLPLTRAAEMKPGDPAYQYTLAVAKVWKKQYEAAQALLEPLGEQ